ncbi:MAG: hypothetical protein GY851_16285, partial [bacterium]|nr:hypothetical protein [bacterium]
AVGDLDGDGLLEIVMATGAGKVFALSASGDPIWEFAVGGTSPDWATSSPIIFGDSKGQVRVAAASRQERIYCLDGGGKVLWERPTRGAVASALSAGDLDNDGRADLFVVTQLGVLYRFDEDGRVVWDIDTQGRSLASGAIIDMDGDGALEYVLCTQRGNLLVFDGSGAVVFSYQFDNRTINVTTAFGDIVKDRPGLEFAVTGGESGRMFCFGTTAPVDTTAQWRTYRGNNRLTGAWLGLAQSDVLRMTPENLRWDALLTGSCVTFRIVNPNPGDSALRAEAACVGPDGSRQAATGKVIGRSGVLEVPLSITAPGEYRFEWSLLDASGATLLAGAKKVTLHPYINDQALAKRAALTLRGAVDQASTVAKDSPPKAAMADESAGIEAEGTVLASLQAAAPGSAPEFREALDARTAALNARSDRALALARAAEAILAEAPASQIVAFEGTTWENRDVNGQLPAAVATPLRIERRCIVGEHEPVSVKLLNVTLKPVEVKVNVHTATENIDVDPCEVKAVPTNQGTTAWDAIVPLGESTLTIPSLETREVWLDIDLAEADSGVHSVSVSFDTGTSQATAEVEFEVLPFEMAGFDQMRLCCWAQYNADAVQDLLAHGSTVFVTSLPPAKVGDGGSVEVDFSALDEFVAPMAGHDVYLLMSGIPALGVPMEEAGYVPRLTAYLDQLFAHLDTTGISEERVALYPHDEPGGHGWDTVHHYIAFARQGLKARPGLKFYVNGGGDLGMFEALNEVAAIWCPGYYMLQETTQTMKFLRSSGKILWSYDCGYSYARPIGANTKTINVAGQFRLAPLFGLNFGATGIGYWCYNVGPSMWDAIRDEYPLVYVNDDETHTASRRWEAVREGMEDARIVIALRDRLETGTAGPAADAIRTLLETSLPALANQSLDEVTLGAARYVLDATNNDDAVDGLRGEILDCVELLAEKR